MVTTTELKRRWSEPDQPRLARQVRTWLTGHGPRPDGLDIIDGRTDLRGIPLSATPMSIGDEDDPSVGVTWDSLNLSGAQLEHLRFFAGQINNCTFDTASINGLRLWGTEITNSTFRRADLRNSALGTGVWHDRRNTWRRASFDRANLRGTSFTAAILDQCTFEKTSKGLQFIDYEISDCSFRGELGAIAIAGRGHRYPVDPSAISADFSKAVLREFYIEGYRVDRVILPEQDDIVVIHNYPQVFRAAAAWLRRPDATEAEQRKAGIFDYRLKAPGAEDSDYVSALSGYGDPETAAIVAQAFAQSHLDVE